MHKVNCLFLLLTCCNCKDAITTLAEYSNYPVKYAKTKIPYPTNDFSITIPKNQQWSAEEYKKV